MAVLSFKTRGMTDPKGKPRVYFCCHPEEHEKYFNAYSEELLKLQNCAVWYCDPKAERDEEFLGSLHEMQLFVMPVTAKLLYTHNPALAVEFSYAVQNHIPVLPIIEESGLVEVFNKKCGDIQFLDRNAEDDTAISYSEKLQKYLASVLVGDELAEKVRAAFDAYVFLSYRKKDRKHAQELMKLIHQNDFCRDIAIWYDEYLTPGENFNDSIEAALQKSGLFVLAVTPNLVNEDNYIMTTEYPMAKEQGKPILPAELIPTDRVMLAQKYADIPQCTDAHNEAELSSALLQAVRKMAVKENDASPEHNFFIGLAYLNGIDVEVDRDRALSLITSAAEAGLKEALQQLVQMYRNGKGVTRSYKTAIEWQHKLAESLISTYNAEPDDETLKAAVRELFLCGDFYAELAQTKQAIEQYLRARDIAEGHPEQQSVVTKRTIFACNQRLGSAYTSMGDLGRAKEHYKKCVDIAVTVGDDINDRRNLYAAFNNIGTCFKADGDISNARKSYTGALDLAEQLAEETGDLFDLRAVRTCLYNLGGILLDEGKAAEAEKLLLEAKKRAFDIKQIDPSLRSVHDLASVLSLLGMSVKRQGRFAEAKKHYLLSVEGYEIIVEATEAAADKYNLCIIYNDTGLVLQENGELQEAKKYHKRVLDITLHFVKQCDIVGFSRLKAHSLMNLGNIAKNEGDISTAMGYYKNACQEWFRLAEQTGSVADRTSLAICYNNFGLVFMKNGELKFAESHYLKAAEIYKSLAEQTQRIAPLRGIANADINIAGIRFEQKDYGAAREFYLSALEKLQKLIRESGENVDLVDEALCYSRLGVISKRENDLVKTEEYYRKSLERKEIIAQRSGTAKALKNLAEAYSCLGWVLAKLDKQAEAKEMYLKSAEKYGMLREKADSDAHKRLQAAAFKDAGHVAFDTSDTQLAKECYFKHVEIFEQLADETRSDPDRYELATGYNNVATVFHALGEDGTAKLYIVRFLKISESLYQKTQEVKYLAAVGMANYNLYLSSTQPQAAEYISKACSSMARASRLCPENENYRRLFKKYADVIIKITQEQQ